MPNDLDDDLVRIARQSDERRYGKFRATVTDNQDPQKRARLRVRVPSVLSDQETDWALPCLPYGGAAGSGLYAVPGVGAQVWLEFEEGDIARPVWTGTFWQDGADVPTDAAGTPPTRWVLETPAGHRLAFDDADGARALLLRHAAGAELAIDDTGSIEITDAKGATLVLDAQGESLKLTDSHGNSMRFDASGAVVEDSQGNRIEMASAGITVKGQQIVVQGSQVMLGGQGGEPVIKGSSFLTLFATHMHPTAVGPSGPPIPQGEMSALSTRVMTA